MSRWVGVAIVVVLALLALAAMWWGWRRRATRTGTGLQAEHAGEIGDIVGSAVGVYVSSTIAGQWLERITADGLGARSPVTVQIGTRGIALRRGRAGDVVIGEDGLRGARREDGIAGKVTGRGGIVVIRWRGGEVDIDTGLRLRHPDQIEPLISAVNSLTHHTKDAA